MALEIHFPAGQSMGNMLKMQSGAALALCTEVDTYSLNQRHYKEEETDYL